MFGSGAGVLKGACTLSAWFSLSAAAAAASSDPLAAEEAMRRRLQSAQQPQEDSEREANSDNSSCSESVGAGSTSTTAFRPSASTSPGLKDTLSSTAGPSGQQHSGSTDYPSPNISVGPPIHPPPHLLPYLYPHGLYPGAAGAHPLLAPGPPLSLFTGAAGHGNPAMNPSLLFNAQLALAAQHPALFSHAAAYSAAGLTHPHHPHHITASGSPTGPLHHQLKTGAHRFTPYNLPVVPPTSNSLGGSPLGSAFETVTPGSLHNSHSNATLPSRSLSNSPTPTKQTTPPPPPLSGSPPSSGDVPNSTPPTTIASSTTASELKSIEKMVNGLEVKPNNNSEVVTSANKCSDDIK